MVNCTFTGLKEFKKERDALKRDIKGLKSLVNSKTGHLGDIIGCLRTIMSSMEIKAERLNDIFKEQKSM